jgi:hypothetical protein
MLPGTAREASKLRPHHRSYGPECSDGDFAVSLLPAFALAANRAVEYRADRSVEQSRVEQAGPSRQAENGVPLVPAYCCPGTARSL